jgi:hypothetical protein
MDRQAHERLRPPTARRGEKKLVLGVRAACASFRPPPLSMRFRRRNPISEELVNHAPPGAGSIT